MDYITHELYHTNYRPDRFYWRRSFLGYTFSLTRAGGGACTDHGEGAASVANVLRNWLQTHEEAQVMVASVLVVIGIWWLIRTVISLVINLVCPIAVVLLAVLMVPQLRVPLLGQNYPAVANVIHNILIKMAEGIKAG